jgi:hypothetical protein
MAGKRSDLVMNVATWYSGSILGQAYHVARLELLLVNEADFALGAKRLFRLLQRLRIIINCSIL